MSELWKDIAGYPRYQVSSLGRIRTWLGRKGARLPEPWILKQAEVRGYRRISLTQDGEDSGHFVHRLVLEAFVGPRPDGMQACHQNGVRSDNRCTNLRWDTCKRNHADKRAHGTAQIGEKHPRAILDEASVVQMRVHKGWLGSDVLASTFGVCRSAVVKVWSKQLWPHVDVEQWLRANEEKVLSLHGVRS
jgi:hypothetical protein